MIPNQLENDHALQLFIFTWSVPSEKAVQHDKHASWFKMIAHPCLKLDQVWVKKWFLFKPTGEYVRPLTAVTDPLHLEMWRGGWKKNFKNFIGCHTNYRSAILFGTNSRWMDRNSYYILSGFYVCAMYRSLQFLPEGCISSLTWKKHNHLKVFFSFLLALAWRVLSASVMALCSTAAY